MSATRLSESDRADRSSEATEARALHRLGVEQFNAGQPVASTRTLRRALSLIDASTDASASALAARIWISIALNDAEVRGADHGLRTLVEAERHVIAAGAPDVRALLHCQRGVIEMRRGDLDTALHEFGLALRSVDQVDPLDACMILLNTGTAHLYRGDLGRARHYLTRAAELGRQIGDRVREFKARHNLGYVEFLAGRLPLALETMDAALLLRPELSPGVALLDRARVLVEVGLTREADETLERAGAYFARERRTQDVAEAELARAECALLAGDVPAARRYAARARDRFRRRENNRWRRSAELVLLQSDLAAGRPGSRLTGPALRLREEFAEKGLRVRGRTASLIAVEAMLSAGRVDPASALLDSLPPARGRDPITTRLHGRYVSARVALARGDGRGAAAATRHGLGELAEYQALFGSIDLRTASAVHGRRLAELDIGLALGSGRAGAVFAAAERARAVAGRLAPVRPPEDAAAAELLAQLRRTAESLRGVEQDRAAARQLQRRRGELEREITARRWTLAGSGRARAPAGLGEVRAELAAADATMVTFVEAAGTIHGLVTAAGHLRLHRLGDADQIYEQVRRARADLDVLAAAMLPGGLQAAVSGSFIRSMAELDSTLLQPLRLAGRVVIVPTGSLGQLPWSALPSLAGVPVVVAPSASVWLAATSSRPAVADSVVCLAGPDLDRAAGEAAGVASVYAAATVSTHDAATRGAFAAAMSDAAVVHVAAHGTHQTENPLFSSVRMADGPIYAHELDATARTADHVVLSACELGLATVRPGDEALGLTSVLLHLGTRCVVAGVARVGDDLAAETMTAYHARLAAGDDAAAALAAAIAETAAGRPVPFVCFGASWRMLAS